MVNETVALFIRSKTTPYVFNSFIALACLNMVLFFTASFGNILIVLSLRKESLLHPPSRLLLRNLALTDLFVGLFTHPLATLHSISILVENVPIFQFTVRSSYVSSAILSGMSLFVLTLISVDRLLALSLGMKYRQEVTARRVRGFVIFFWVLNTANGLALLSRERFVFYIFSASSIFLCMIISTFCYAKIYRILRLQEMKVRTTCSQKQKNKNSLLSVKRYKKTVSNALWVHLTLLACYFPYSIVSGLKAVTKETWAVAEGFTGTLIFFNSSLNPLLYYWRIKEVRQALLEMIRQYRSLLLRET